jgi:hypothetical protein
LRLLLSIRLFCQSTDRIFGQIFVDDVLVFKGSLHKSPEYETVASDLDKYNSQIKHSRGTQSRWNPSSVDALGAIAEGGLRWVTPYGLDLSQSIIFSNNPDILEREVSDLSGSYRGSC